jgi:hypothetical protein
MVEEGKKSVWARSLLLRVTVYSMSCSVLAIGLVVFGWWLQPPRIYPSVEGYLRELAGIACVFFWTTFILGSSLGLRRKSGFPDVHDPQRDGHR